MSVYNRGRKPTLTPAADALTKTPPAPKYLSALAQQEWKRVAPILVTRRVLTKSDLSALEVYAMAFGAARQIAETMAASDLPDLKMAGLQIRYMHTARQFGAEFGLTPSSRQRISAASNDDDDDTNPLNL